MNKDDMDKKPAAKPENSLDELAGDADGKRRSGRQRTQPNWIVANNWDTRPRGKRAHADDDEDDLLSTEEEDDSDDDFATKSTTAGRPQVNVGPPVPGTNYDNHPDKTFFAKTLELPPVTTLALNMDQGLPVTLLGKFVVPWNISAMAKKLVEWNDYSDSIRTLVEKGQYERANQVTNERALFDTSMMEWAEKKKEEDEDFEDDEYDYPHQNFTSFLKMHEEMTTGEGEHTTLNGPCKNPMTQYMNCYWMEAIVYKVKMEIEKLVEAGELEKVEIMKKLWMASVQCQVPLIDDNAEMTTINDVIPAWGDNALRTGTIQGVEVEILTLAKRMNEECSVKSNGVEYNNTQFLAWLVHRKPKAMAAVLTQNPFSWDMGGKRKYCGKPGICDTAEADRDHRLLRGMLDTLHQQSALCKTRRSKADKGKSKDTSKATESYKKNKEEKVDKIMALLPQILLNLGKLPTLEKYDCSREGERAENHLALVGLCAAFNRGTIHSELDGCKFVPLASALLGSTQEEIEKHIHSRKLSKAKDGDVAVVISRHKKYKHIPSNNGTKEDIELKKTLKQEFDHLKKCRDDNMDKQPKAKKPKAKKPKAKKPKAKKPKAK